MRSSWAATVARFATKGRRRARGEITRRVRINYSFHGSDVRWGLRLVAMTMGEGGTRF